MPPIVCAARSPWSSSHKGRSPPAANSRPSASPSGSRFDEPAKSASSGTEASRLAIRSTSIGERERGDVRRRRKAGVLERPVDVVVEARVALSEVHDRDALLREPPGHDRLVRLVHEPAHGLVLLLQRVAPSLGLLELAVEVVQLGLLDVRCRLLEVAAAGDRDADHDADREGDEDRSERGDVVTEIEHAGLAFRGHEESWR